jgi:hypothetical protein
LLLSIQRSPFFGAAGATCPAAKLVEICVRLDSGGFAVVVVQTPFTRATMGLVPGAVAI